MTMRDEAHDPEQPDPDAGEVAAAPEGVLHTAGYYVVDNYWSRDECQRIVQAIERYIEEADVPEIERAPEEGEIPIRYRVITGEAIKRGLLVIWRMVETIQPLAEHLYGGPLEPWQDENVAVNVNVYTSGGSYKAHTDRNAVTALLYPEVADSGGKLGVVTPAGEERMLAPRSGMLVIFLGNRVEHWVTPVKAGRRISIPIAYGKPSRPVGDHDELDAYIYGEGDS